MSARARFDHDAAFAFYAAAGHRRSYGMVAREFGVSEAGVRRVAKRDNWVERVKEIDRKAADRALAKVQQSRDQRVAQALRITDLALGQYEDRLLEQVVDDLRAQDIVALTKLAELLEGEATSRVSIAELQPLLGAFEQAVAELEPLARQVDAEVADRVVRRLDEELTALAGQRAAVAETVPDEVAA